jgi:hypothetical protein
MGNALALVTVLLQLGQQVQAISALLAKAHTEGRDVTAEELDGLFAADAAARAQLQAAIDAAKAAGG